jgi:hypothetical protein
MLSFTEQLKELIQDVETRGGSPVQKISPPPELMLKLKGYVIKRLREQPEPLSQNLEFFLLEEFNEGFFEEGIRVCLIHLGEMGITDQEEVSHILHKVIDRRLEMMLGKGDERHRSTHYADKISIDDALAERRVRMGRIRFRAYHSIQLCQAEIPHRLGLSEKSLANYWIR